MRWLILLPLLAACQAQALSPAAYAGCDLCARLRGPADLTAVLYEGQVPRLVKGFRRAKAQSEGRIYPVR